MKPALHTVVVAALLAPGLVLADPPGRDTAGAVAEARARADAAATRLLQALLADLTAEMAEGGPARAIRVCSDTAQSITRSLGEQQGLAIRRTSLRTRNPANAPDAFERAWLEAAQKEPPEGHPPETAAFVLDTEGGGRELRMLRPIVFPGGICSQCHGLPDEIPPEIGALLQELYPEDRATGYRKGDLRGAVSVRVPLPSRISLPQRIR